VTDRHKSDLKLVIIDEYLFGFSPIELLDPAMFWKNFF
jgi:hypothetical protein